MSRTFDAREFSLIVVHLSTRACTRVKVTFARAVPRQCELALASSSTSRCLMLSRFATKVQIASNDANRDRAESSPSSQLHGTIFPKTAAQLFAANSKEVIYVVLPIEAPVVSLVFSEGILAI